MRDAGGEVRTTLVIDDDVLVAAKAIASAQQRSIGEVVSELARNALRKPAPPAIRNGIPLLPRRAGQAPVTLEMVNALAAYA
jgi:hypothetical protein